MSADPKLFDETVERLKANFLQGGKHADELAMMSMHAAVQHFAETRGWPFAFDMIAQFYDALAKRAAEHRERRPSTPPWR